MNKWLIASLCVLVLLVVYISYYYRYPRHTEILQTTLAEFKFDMLLSKQPIVIQDRVADIAAVRKAWFPSNIVREGAMIPEDKWHTNNFKYAIIQSPSLPITLFFLGAHTALSKEDKTPPTTATLTGIQLAPLQLAILPFKSHFLIQSEHAPLPTVRTIGIHDYVTVLIP